MTGSGQPPLPDSSASDLATQQGALLPSHLAAVAIGGAIGAVLRHIVNHHSARLMPEHPERATLLINAAGSLLLGGLLAWVIARPDHLPPALQTGLAVGLLGAFTTYSTFSVDAFKLLQAGRVGEAAVYVVTTTVLCIALAAGGYALVTVLLGKSP